MATYSELSKERLSTCHEDLQKLFSIVILYFDNSIICGYRGEAEQTEAYNSGQSKVKFPDGKHNQTPSMAVDAAPYPIEWGDRERMTLFAGYVLGVAEVLHNLGAIQYKVRWGGDWDQDTEVSDNSFDDLVHFELVK